MAALLGLWSRLRQTARLMVGVPDYDTYVAHRLAHHPGEPVMSYEEFFRAAQQRRYAGTGCGAAAEIGPRSRLYLGEAGTVPPHGCATTRPRPPSSISPSLSTKLPTRISR